MKTNLENGKRGRYGGLLFLVATILPYLLLSPTHFPLVRQAFSGFLIMLGKIVPVLLLVFVIMVVFDLLLAKTTLERHLGRESGVRGLLYALFGGILVSGPPYLLYPLLGDLKRKGMTNALIAVFLYNRNVKIPFLPLMVYYFGLPFTVVMSVYIILFSLVNGLVVGELAPDGPE